MRHVVEYIQTFNYPSYTELASGDSRRGVVPGRSLTRKKLKFVINHYTGEQCYQVMVGLDDPIEFKTLQEAIDAYNEE